MRHTTAATIEKSVRALYAKNGCVVLSEVRNGTGYSRAPRTADILVVSTWPSRGLFAEGIEIKVSRTDLKKELSSPEKAEAIARYCKYWWLAVPDDLLTPEFTVPETWGIIETDVSGKAKVTRPATVLQPIEMDTLLVCSILRNFAESHIHTSDIEERLAAERDKAQKDARSEREYYLKRLEEGYLAFKEHSGVDLLDEKRSHPIWEMRSVGEAVRLVAGMHGRSRDELVQAQVALRAAAAAIEVALPLMGEPPDAPLAKKKAV